MRAVVVRAHGGPESLELTELPVPEPGPGEIRIRVQAVGLNHLDVWVRKGVPGHVFPLPIVPGCDVAGVVDALGAGATGAAAGDEVVVGPLLTCGRCRACRCREAGILGESRDGGCAEYVVVPQANVFPRPRGLDATAAAAVPLTFLTAWHMLRARARVQPGERVMIHAAGSGVSTAAIQIATLLGARVLATAGSDAKCARAIELGAEQAVNYRSGDFVAEARRFAGRDGLDVVLDHVGAETFERSLRCLGRGGRYVTCGSTSGHELKTDFRLVFFKSLSILGSTLGSSHELATILDLVTQGRLKPVIDAVLPLERVAEAHARLEAREVFGKLVLTVGSA
jgi:NADPH:quinone reductase-like Zn-dependent oxidoreductase